MKRALLFAMMFLAVVSFVHTHNGHTQSKYTIAVLDFKDVTGDSALSYLSVAVPELIATNLAQSGKMVVLERERVKKILEEKGLTAAGVTEGDANEIGKLLAAKQLLTGSVARTGENLRIDVRLIDVNSGKIMSADKQRSPDVDGVIDAVDIISGRMVKSLTGSYVDFSGDVEPGRPVVNTGLVTLELQTQNRYISKSNSGSFYVRTGFLAGKAKRAEKRLPLNISVVLDRSGSMSDRGKLDYARDAMKFLVRNLESADILSIVTYDDVVDVALEPEVVSDKNKIYKIIDAIEPGGGTNLSGGMLEGCNQVKKKLKSNQVNRVLLISDGLANVGVTDPRQIQQLARQRSGEGITISTFGVGQYFNEKLMTGIAEYGSAFYYYIDRADKIPEIFSNELEGLLAVVAQNCSIEIRPEHGTLVKKVYGYTAIDTDDGVVIKMGDVVSEEKKLALLALIPSGQSISTGVLATVVYTYDETVKGEGRISSRKKVTVTSTTDSKLVSRNINPLVMKDVKMFVSSSMMEETMDLVDKGRVDDAKAKIQENLEVVRDGLSQYKSREMKRQVMNIVEYQSRLERASEEQELNAASESYQMMQKDSRSKQYNLRKRK